MVLPSVLVIFLTFLPSIIELKRPRDAGPKLIHDSFIIGYVLSKFSLMDIEAGIGGKLSTKGFSFPVAIDDLEA
jgi:hypothetical protein